MKTYFETIKCDDNEVFNISYHQKRIARTIGLNLNLGEYIFPPSDQLLKCKVVYDQENILDISYITYTKRNTNKFKIIYDNSIEYKHKSTNRDKINKLYEKKENCDDIIIIKNGLITDTSIANIAIKLDEIWYTPKTPLLHGTCRDKLVDEFKLVEKDLTVKELQNAQQFATINAMIEFNIIEKFLFID